MKARPVNHTPPGCPRGRRRRRGAIGAPSLGIARVARLHLGQHVAVQLADHRPVTLARFFGLHLGIERIVGRGQTGNRRPAHRQRGRERSARK